MNKHDDHFQWNRFWDRKIDHVVVFDHLLNRFLRKFRDTMDEAIG